MGILIKVIGLINACYLVYLHSNTSSSCGVLGNCSEVLGSIFGSVFNVPLAAYGVSLFLVLLLLELFNKTKSITNNLFESLTIAILIPSTAISIVLLGVQIFYIKSFCQFCTLNSIIIITLLIHFYITKKETELDYKSLKLPVLVSLLSIFMLPVVSNIKKDTTKNEVIGTIGNEEIMFKDMKDSEYFQNIQFLERDIRNLKKDYFNDKLLDFVAKKQKKSKKDYLKTEIENNILVSETEMKAFYDENKHHLRNNESFETVKQSIRNIIYGEKSTIKIRKHLKDLKKEYNAKFLVLPKYQKVYVNSNPHQSLSIGDKSASVHIIEFADIECHHCKLAFFTMKKIIEKYKDDVYFEFRYAPLPFNKYSKEFSKGTICAEKQNKGFDYLELIFKNQRNLANFKTDSFALNLNLDIDEFNSCITNPATSLILNYDINEADRIGVNRTPTFIINNEMISGAPKLNEIIDYIE